MRNIASAVIGAIICFFSLRQCDTPKTQVITKTKTVTEFVEVPAYTETIKTVKIPVTSIKYVTNNVHDTSYQMVNVEVPGKIDTSVAFIPYSDSTVTIQDSITLTGTILDFKRKVTVLDKTPDTIKVTTIKEIAKPKSIKYYVGADSDFKNLFQPSFGLSYDQPKYQIAVGYRPTVKIVEARLFLPLFKFK